MNLEALYDGSYKSIKRILKFMPTVMIIKSDETGEIRYAVVLKSNPGFWLMSSKRLESAKRFVEKHGLEIHERQQNDRD
jgi:hypothetical protein